VPNRIGEALSIIGGACRLDHIIGFVRRALSLGRQFSGAIGGLDSGLPGISTGIGRWPLNQ